MSIQLGRGRAKQFNPSTRRRRAMPDSIGPRFDALESRQLLSVTLLFDYTYDTNGFFAEQSRRDLLELAAGMIEERLADNLDAITPGGSNTWTASFTHPGTGNLQTIDNLNVPANTVIVYAGGRNLGSTLGLGGFGGFNVGGSTAFIDIVSARGEAGALASPETDFGPWGGALTFNTTSNWFFGEDIAGIGGTQNDFLSVALHEITHLLGFGTAPSFDALVSAGTFIGPRATAEYDGPGSPPLFGDNSHWATDLADEGEEVAMDPALLNGTRKLLTELDFAALDDLGWEVTGPGGGMPEVMVSRGGIEILDGDATPGAADGTDFGTIDQGQPAVTRTFTVRNNGNAILGLGALTLPTGFSLTEGLSASLDPGVSDTFTVQLNPAVAGAFVGDISIVNSDSDENPFNFRITGTVVTPQEITVLGNGVTISDGDTSPAAGDHTDFGTVAMGQIGVMRTFTVRNDGGTTLTLGSVSVPSGFILSDPLTLSLAPGTSDTFTVQLSTFNAGTFAGDVSFTSNDGDESPFNFRVTGTVSVGLPEVTVSGNSVTIVDGDSTPSTADHTDLGTVAQGSAASTRTYTVRNDGASTLTLGTVSVPAGFTVAEPLATSIAAGMSDTFTVQMSTAGAGTFAGDISFTTNDSDENPFNFRITGTVSASVTDIEVRGGGVAIPDGDVTPASADGTDFGQALASGQTVARTFTIANTGNAALTLTGNPLVQITGAAAGDFTVTTLPVSPVAAAGQTTFVVTFDPSAAGLRQANISIANSDPDENPYSFAIAGTGLADPAPEIEVAGSSVVIVDGDATPSAADMTSFGPAIVDGGQVFATFTIRNTGTATLTLGNPAVTISGAAAADFTVTATPVTSLVANDFTSFQVRFDPSAAGLREATLSIASNDGDENPYTFTVSGEGISRIERARVGGAFKSATVSDDFGNVFDISYSGVGSAGIFEEGDGRLSVVVAGPDAKSKLTIKRNKASTGDGLLDSLEGNGPLAGVAAAGIGFLGDILFDGRVASFVAGNLNSAGPHEIRFGGVAFDKQAAITLGRLTDVAITSTGPVQVTVLNWTDTDPQTNKDALTAPWATNLIAKGDSKLGVEARWDADVTLSGQGATKLTLGSLKAVSASNATLMVTGDVGTIDLSKGVQTLFNVIATGIVGTVKLGDAANVVLEAAALGTVQAVRWLGGGIDTGTLKTLKTVGNSKIGVIGDLTADILASGDGNVKTPELGSASIKGAASGVWNILGAAGKIAADSFAAGFSATIRDDFKGLDSKGDFRGLLAAATIASFSVKANVIDATIIAGSIANRINSIGSAKVGGAWTNSTIEVGVRFGADGLAGTADDTLVADPANLIKSLSIGLDAAGTNPLFAASTFPKTVSINKVKVDPLTDARFLRV